MIHITRPSNYNLQTLQQLEEFLTGPGLRLSTDDYCVGGNLGDPNYINSLKAIFIVENYLSEKNTNGDIVGEGCYRIFEKYKSKIPIFFVNESRINHRLYISKVSVIHNLEELKSYKKETYYGFSHIIVTKASDLLSIEFMRKYVFHVAEDPTDEKVKLTSEEVNSMGLSAAKLPNYLLISSLKR